MAGLLMSQQLVFTTHHRTVKHEKKFVFRKYFSQMEMFEFSCCPP